MGDIFHANASEAHDDAVYGPDYLRGRETRTAYAYWQSKSVNGALPSFADIDPSDIRKLLTYSIVSDVLQDPFDLKVAIMGQVVVETLGENWTGRTLRELVDARPALIEPVLKCHERVFETRSPLAFSSSYWMIGRANYTREVLILPLANDGTTINRHWSVGSYFKRGGSETP